ncbi:MAG: hypothetical protein ACLGI2_10465 [Acidimicrobiia bacterium]
MPDENGRALVAVLTILAALLLVGGTLFFTESYDSGPEVGAGTSALTVQGPSA